MEIERINEDTVKFFLSYVDIEERGFTREEVWNNREKSEELFWDMMDEINEQSEFAVEGPLWIQVHAKNDGIEVTVTRALANDGQMIESPFYDEDPSQLFQEQDDGTFEDIEDILKNGLNKENDWLENTFVFNDFEDVISITSRMHDYEAHTSLYAYESKYYLHVKYDVEEMDNKQKTNMFSVLSEFAKPDKITIHILQEYGKVIFESDVFSQIEKYF
ncbi:adaptor protein MecA [Sporosarcina pasteurii]|uniref:Adapter protein MecA n=1 Tax=Sporosarcina pasteurii TaxID=1474 RepID=A0A380BDY7_SPOPA|nr:adaptor protein MecA [Sporosarcina pasteurii]MDS9470376.1 adaptor protein MecA [Sporosarcina pasteurii]QBQ05918.1 adaptor protein MecA [Sporosarcina pasteurii]SUI99920.1 Adapter protein mecA 1 [Sporosarcina pasteurii]